MRASQEFLHNAWMRRRTTAAPAGSDDVDPEAGLGAAGRMSAAVVGRKQLDVLVGFPPIDLVLDAVVGEVHLTVEVRQVVFASPVPDLPLVAVGAAVAVGAVSVVFLQKLLVLALQVLLEDDAADVEAAVLVSETGFLLAVRRVEVRVVVDFAGPADASVERLRWFVAPIHHVRIEKVPAILRQRQATFVAAKVNEIDEALIPQMVERLVVDVEVVFGHDPEGAEGGQRAAVLAVQLVGAIAINDKFALPPPWQAEV